MFFFNEDLIEPMTNLELLVKAPAVNSMIEESHGDLTAPISTILYEAPLI